MDELGSAALDVYEQTQRTPQHVRARSVSDSRQEPRQLATELSLPTGSGAAPAVAHSKHAQTRSTHEGSSTEWKEIRGSATGDDSGQPTLVGEPGESELSQLRSELREKAERLCLLEEKGYEKEGEVKLLRSELKKKDDQLRELHGRFTSEQRQKEEQVAREKNSLATQLEFKEQELATLRERCSSLEQRQRRRSSLTLASPAPVSRLPQKPADGHGSQKKTDFLSTETFMPLSQMSQSDVTPVHVAGHVSKRERIEAKGLAATSQPSPVPSQVTPRVENVEGEETSGVRNRLGQVASSKPPHSSTPQSGDKMDVASPSTPNDSGLVRLNVPPLEVSGHELLMLLADKELLKVPSFKDENDEEDSTNKEESASQSADTPSSLPGLFSLLHIPPPSSSSSSSSLFSSKSTLFSSLGGTVTTPVSRFHQHVATPPSVGTSASIPSTSEMSSDSLPRTPARKSKLQLHHKPHTCSRTDLSRSRTRAAPDDFPLRKALSASNTPVHESTTMATLPVTDSEEQQVSRTLLKSVDVESLTGSILSLLTDGDTSTVMSMLNQSSTSRTPTPFPSLPPSLANSAQQPPSCFARGGGGGESPSVEIKLLLDLGGIVERYVAEQTELARASAMNTTLDFDSLDTQSPKSSLGSSTATSSSRNGAELNEPSRADQSFVCRSLEILETLVMYSRQAREQLTAEPLPLPPKCLLEDEAAETLDKSGEGAGDGESATGTSQDTTEQMKMPTDSHDETPKVKHAL